MAISLSLSTLHAAAQEKVIRLYDGPAPGSEDWKQTEQENRTNLWNTRLCLGCVVHNLLIADRW